MRKRCSVGSYEFETTLHPRLDLYAYSSRCLHSHNFPTGPFRTIEPQEQDIEFHFVQRSRATDFEAPKVLKGLARLYAI